MCSEEPKGYLQGIEIEALIDCPKGQALAQEVLSTSGNGCYILLYALRVGSASSLSGRTSSRRSAKAIHCASFC